MFDDKTVAMLTFMRYATMAVRATSSRRDRLKTQWSAVSPQTLAALTYQNMVGGSGPQLLDSPLQIVAIYIR